MERDRLVAFGAELTETHDRLRATLDRLRAGDRGPGDRREGDRRPADLRSHCLAFCAALTAHHTDEDTGVFPALAERYPDLRPVIAKLVEDHDMISGIIARIEAAADDDMSELDGLAAILESHFAFEERRIAAALRA